MFRDSLLSFHVLKACSYQSDVVQFFYSISAMCSLYVGISLISYLFKHKDKCHGQAAQQGQSAPDVAAPEHGLEK